MRIIIILLTVFFLPFNSYSLNNHSIITKFESEIAPELRLEIEKKTEIIINYIIQINSEEFNKLLYKDFYKNVSSNASKFLTSDRRVIEIFEKRGFTTIDEYFCTVEKIDRDKLFTIVPSKERSLIVNIKIPGKQSFMTFLKNSSKNYSYLLFMQFIKEPEEWKLNYLAMGNYAINNQIAPDLVDQCNRLYHQDKLASAALYGLAARKVLRPKPFLQYKKEKEYIKAINEVLNETNQKYNFPIEIKDNLDMQLFSLDISISSEGIVPIIKYLDPKRNNNEDTIRDRASKLLPKVYEIFPDLKITFPYIILQAYDEPPVDPKKRYNVFNSIFKDSNLFIE
jgi:hypothetical protein